MIIQSVPLWIEYVVGGVKHEIVDWGYGIHNTLFVYR